MGGQQKFLTGSAYSTGTKVAGQVELIDYLNKLMVIDYGSGRGIYSTDTISEVYLYGADRGVVEKGALNDIGKGTYIYAHIKQYKADKVVVIIDK